MEIPAFITHFLTEDTQLIQTHISYVLSNAAQTIKVKKPQDFGFLNFTKKEDRKRFCKAEITLNRRYSDAIYKKAVAIIATNTGYTLTDDIDTPHAIDYAVVMNTFEQEAILKHKITQQPLEKDLLHELATKIAIVHTERAISNDHIQSFGMPERIRTMFNKNLELTASLVGVTISQKDYEKLLSFFNSFIDTHLDLLINRVHKGFIKECHGDLHLGNICIYKEKVQAFDCIEFNEDFRFIDIIYDLSFLLMDLDYQKDKPGSNYVLNKYLEITNDYEGGCLLNFYKSMRALIRGNVISLELNDASIDPQQKTKATKEAKAFFDLALSYTQSLTAKCYAVSGVSGSGKSFFAYQLSDKLNAIIIRSDVIRKHLCGVRLTDRDASIYTSKITQQTYEQIAFLGKSLADAGYSIILDATFTRPSYRSIVKNSIPSLQFILCTAPLSVIEKRLLNRKNDVADADVSIMQQQLTSFDKLKGENPIVISTDQSIDFSLFL